MTLKNSLFHFLTPLICTHSCFKKKRIWVLTHISECSFHCTDLLTCILFYSFHCSLILVFKSSLCCKVYTLVSSQRSLLQTSNICILGSSTIFTYIHFLTTENKWNSKEKYYKILVLTEYATGEKLLLPSSISSAPAIFFSLYFPFSLLFCTSVSSLLDSSHKIYFSSESWLSILANFSNATTILQIFNLLNLFNFLEMSAFYSVFICCFVFLILDLQTTSVLAFAHALFASKGL